MKSNEVEVINLNREINRLRDLVKDAYREGMTTAGYENWEYWWKNSGTKRMLGGEVTE